MNRNEIHVIYGTKPLAMIQELLDQAKAFIQLDPGMNIALKPNLVVAKPASEGLSPQRPGHRQVSGEPSQLIRSIGYSSNSKTYRCKFYLIIELTYRPRVLPSNDQ